jgi:putative ABC transport system permease protein
MKLVDILVISFRNLSQRSLRSWLTILGIVIGVAAVVSMLSIGEGMRSSIISQLSVFGPDIVMVMPGSSRTGGGDITGLIRAVLSTRGMRTLSDKDIEAIKSVEGVKDVEGEVIGAGFVTYNAERMSATIRGVDPNKWREMLNVEIGDGRDFQPNERRVVILGYRIANEMFSQPISVESQITIGGISFRVIGILKESGGQMGVLDNVIFMNIKDARDVLTNIEKDKYSLINVKIADVSQVDDIVSRIDEALMRERKETPDKKTYTIISAKQIAQTVNMIISSMNLFLGGIAGVSLIVGAVGIANTMFTSVMERTRQIGTLKALGAKNSEIMKMFLFESALIGFVGGLIGIFAGFIVTGLLNEFSIRMFSAPGMRMSSAIITPDLIILGLSFATIIGALSGLIPAKRAAELEPVEALRYE